MVTPVVSYITFWFAIYEEQTCGYASLTERSLLLFTSTTVHRVQVDWNPVLSIVVEEYHLNMKLDGLALALGCFDDGSFRASHIFSIAVH